MNMHPRAELYLLSILSKDVVFFPQTLKYEILYAYILQTMYYFGWERERLIFVWQFLHVTLCVL